MNARSLLTFSLAAVVSLTATGAVMAQAPSGPPRPKFDVGAMAPAIEVTTMDGKPWKFSEQKGKVVALFFWAKGSRSDLPWLNDLKGVYDRYHAKGFEVFGINCDGKNEEAELRGWLLALGMPWPNYFEGSGMANKVARQWGIPGQPYLIFIDRTGKVRYVNVSGDSVETMAKVLTAE